MLLTVFKGGGQVSPSCRYTLQATRDMIELSEGRTIHGSVSDSQVYSFYKFHKVCGDGCDVTISVKPMSLLASIDLVVEL